MMELASLQSVRGSKLDEVINNLNKIFGDKFDAAINSCLLIISKVDPN